MSAIKFSGGQTVDSDKILLVSVLEEKLEVETDVGPIRIQGAGVHADLVLLKDVRTRKSCTS
jgi:hypothetical protein